MNSSSNGIVSLLGGAVVFAISAICFVIWLWLLIHAIRNKGLTDGERIVWVLVIIFLPCLGPLLYFFIGRPKQR